MGWWWTRGVLREEVEKLEEAGAGGAGAAVSERGGAHDRAVSQAAGPGAGEAARGGGRSGRRGGGIGGAYADKVARQGVRLADLRDKNRLAERITALDRYYKPLFQYMFEERLPAAEDVLEEIWEVQPLIKPLLCDSVSLVNGMLKEGKTVLGGGGRRR